MVHSAIKHTHRMQSTGSMRRSSDGLHRNQMNIRRYSSDQDGTTETKVVTIEESQEMDSSTKDLEMQPVESPIEEEPTIRGNHGMESSSFRFHNVNFVAGTKKDPKNVLTDVSCKVKFGHVLAVMGPSGAGKTTLISALTLDAFYGEASGEVTLNGVPLTDEIFKRHAFVVKQQDRHWPFLTTRESLTYAAQLYKTSSDPAGISKKVDSMIQKMGLESCTDVRCARLSGGQQRRLSIAVALLKNPTLVFLDEPTSGLDAASASAIMHEIIRVAREERLIIICSIHQPSTKVYNDFDQIMILSRGREAYVGGARNAMNYFESIGHPVPANTNPAEHFLDIVNGDFSSDEEVTSILDTWENGKDAFDKATRRPTLKSMKSQRGVTSGSRRSFFKETSIMFRRHATIIVRDPILYVGRCVVYLLAATFFALVYWNARTYSQDQAQNRPWVFLWASCVPTQMCVVAVYKLNEEFKSIKFEIKNGMISPVSYVLAKTVLVLPIIILFALCAIGIPLYVIQDGVAQSFLSVLVVWSVCFYVFECAAELLAVVFDDPIVGMLQFMGIWFASFLFGGLLLPKEDLYWPFKGIVYVSPYYRYMRSGIYGFIGDAEWEPCDPVENPDENICVPTSDGREVLDALGRIFPIFTSENHLFEDISVLVASAIFFKILSVIAVILKSRGGAGISN